MKGARLQPQRFTVVRSMGPIPGYPPPPDPIQPRVQLPAMPVNTMQASP